tara:strand:+ start:10286 stop:11062 length:777 start_codon:yes stop_codon:yes gene_type:complete
MNKKGQVTIFIIIGVILISAIFLFFVFKEERIKETISKIEKNPESFLEYCLNDKIREAIDIIALRGGYPNNVLYKHFEFEEEGIFVNVSYLCYNQNSYLPCINQKPTFMEDLRYEIKDYIFDDVQGCFDDMTSNFNKLGYDTNIIYDDFYVKILPKRVIIQTESESTLTRSEETATEEDFKVEVVSRLYELSFIVQELVNQEARFCYAEHTGISLIYPMFNIEKFRTGDSDNIYTVEHDDSKEKFRFVVKGCVIPPGI